MFNIGFLWCT